MEEQEAKDKSAPVTPSGEQDDETKVVSLEQHQKLQRKHDTMQKRNKQLAAQLAQASYGNAPARTEEQMGQLMEVLASSPILEEQKSKIQEITQGASQKKAQDEALAKSMGDMAGLLENDERDFDTSEDFVSARTLWNAGSLDEAVTETRRILNERADTSVDVEAQVQAGITAALKQLGHVDTGTPTASGDIVLKSAEDWANLTPEQADEALDATLAAMKKGK